MKLIGKVVMFVFFIAALYFVNHALGFFEIPNVVDFDMWAHLIGAGLILLGAFSYRKAHNP
jgi:hypothetical protein